MRQPDPKSRIFRTTQRHGLKSNFGLHMDEQEFKSHADQALDELYRKLTAASDQYDFEADFNAGALAIEFEDPPAKFVVSPNAPGPARSGFPLIPAATSWIGTRPTISSFRETGQTLTELIAGRDQPATRRRSSPLEYACPASTSRFRSARRNARTATSPRASFRGTRSSTTSDALAAEIAEHIWNWSPETVYLGGGTPSRMVANGDLDRMLGAIPGATLDRGDHRSRAGSITRRSAEAWARSGINRVSLGVQSFVRRELARTGRKHTRRDCGRRGRDLCATPGSEPSTST